jgi:nucleoside-diphosphate-sugar epimerase
VFVDDVARAVVQAAVRPGLEGRTFRLGGAQPVSVADYREAVRAASGGHARLRAIPLPLFALAARALALLGRTGPADVLAFHRVQHTVDSGAAREALDFHPRALADGLAATFDGRASTAPAAPRD